MWVPGIELRSLDLAACTFSLSHLPDLRKVTGGGLSLAVSLGREKERWLKGGEYHHGSPLTPGGMCEVREDILVVPC